MENCGVENVSADQQEKQSELVLGSLNNKEDFRNVIFVEESTVEKSSSGRLFFHQPGSKIQNICARRPKPNHAYKNICMHEQVHVWAGISYRGRTSICIFNGVMDSVSYQDTLDKNYIPFVEERFPDGYRLYQDIDSKHKSKSTRDWMAEKVLQRRVDGSINCNPSWVEYKSGFGILNQTFWIVKRKYGYKNTLNS